MLIIDALKALYKKATTKDAAATSIAGVGPVGNWPDTGPRRAARGAATTERRALSNRVRPWPMPRAKRSTKEE